MKPNECEINTPIYGYIPHHFYDYQNDGEIHPHTFRRASEADERDMKLERKLERLAALPSGSASLDLRKGSDDLHAFLQTAMIMPIYSTEHRISEDWFNERDRYYHGRFDAVFEGQDDEEWDVVVHKESGTPKEIQFLACEGLPYWEELWKSVRIAKVHPHPEKGLEGSIVVYRDQNHQIPVYSVYARNKVTEEEVIVAHLTSDSLYDRTQIFMGDNMQDNAQSNSESGFTGGGIMGERWSLSDYDLTLLTERQTEELYRNLKTYHRAFIMDWNHVGKVRGSGWKKTGSIYDYTGKLSDFFFNYTTAHKMQDIRDGYCFNKDWKTDSLGVWIHEDFFSPEGQPIWSFKRLQGSWGLVDNKTGREVWWKPSGAHDTPEIGPVLTTLYEKAGRTLTEAEEEALSIYLNRVILYVEKNLTEGVESRL